MKNPVSLLLKNSGGKKREFNSGTLGSTGNPVSLCILVFQGLAKYICLDLFSGFWPNLKMGGGGFSNHALSEDLGGR